MRRCFNVDLKVENGCTLLMVFDAMKRMQQECDLIDESVTISYDDKIKMGEIKYKDNKYYGWFI